MKRSTAACMRALQYMRAQQRADGAWEDYSLPIGRSDAWVTAVAAAATSETLEAVADRTDERSEASNSVACATDWLRTHQAESGGWGFNGNVEQDADSTAWAVLALRYGGHQPSRKALSFLHRHACSDGGFRTFLKSDAWGDHHVDVSATVARALWDDMTGEQRKRIARSLHNRSVAGQWQSYWWRSSHYATASVAEANRALRLGLRPEIHVGEDLVHALNSNLDVACALITAVSVDADSRVVAFLTGHLLATQTEEGGWHGSDDLRVTDPECHEPWRDPVGCRYEDESGILTTAFCMRALALQIQ
jgi:hypothetical protein